jgi:hypothetical protein
VGDEKGGELVSHPYESESPIFKNSYTLYSIILYTRLIIQPIQEN